MDITSTSRLLLRDLTLDDIERFSEYRDKVDVSYYQSWNRYPISSAKKRIEYCMKYPFDGTRGSYQIGVVLKEENKLIGDIFLEVLEPTSITIGYTFDNDYWHHGYALESVKAILNHLKDNYEFKTVFAYVLKENYRSIRLLESIGFSQFEKSFIMGDLGYMLKLNKYN